MRIAASAKHPRARDRGREKELENVCRAAKLIAETRISTRRC